MIRAVVDTNVLIRAIIRPEGTIGPIAQRLRKGEYRIIFSPPLVDELLDKLREPRFERKYGIHEENILTFFEELAAQGDMVQPTLGIAACRDEDDNRVLEAAVTGEAGYIVTTDEDLLVLDPYNGIRIIKPHVFAKLLDSR